MKRIWILAAALVLIMIAGGAFAEESGLYKLPDDLEIIREEAFMGNTSVEKVVVPSGVTAIESKAFANSSLSYISLPTTLTSIADDAFSGCSGLTVGAVKGSYAYNWASGKYDIYEEIQLKGVSFNNITETDELLTYTVNPVGGKGRYYYTYKIYRNNKLIHTEKCIDCNTFNLVPGVAGSYKAEVTVKDDFGFTVSATSDSISVAAAKTVPLSDLIYSNVYDTIWIEEYTGTDTSITFPSKINNLPAHIQSLAVNRILKSVALASGTTEIGGFGFWECYNLEGVYLPDSMVSLGSMIFTSTDIRNIIIPPKITFLDGEFFMAQNIQSLTIPSTVTTIKSETFDSCYALKSIYIPTSVKTISPTAFNDCDDTICIVAEGSYAHQYCIDNNINYVFHF